MPSTFPHDLLAVISAGAAAALGVLAFFQFAKQAFGGYKKRYLGGAEQTLDSMYLTMRPEQILQLAVMSAAVCGFSAWIFSRNVVLSIPLALLGLAVPSLVVRILKSRRDRMFNEQLVDALMNISNTLKAGMSLPQAFEVLAREMPNPMRQEMKLMTQELRLGLSMEDALYHLYRRMPSQDLDLVVTSIVITEDVGGNLTEIFDNIAHTIRERFRIEGKIRALTAQGKMQALVICSLPLVVMIGLYYAAPGVVNVLFDSLPGALILFVSLVLEVIGILIIRKIVSIEV